MSFSGLLIAGTLALTLTGPVQPAPRYVALGDSVAAGEGIGEGWTWNAGKQHWVGGSTPGRWDTTFRPVPCHQTRQGYPWVVAARLGADLKDFACTGASGIDGILGVQPDRDLDGAQLGWTGAAPLAGAAPANLAYDAPAPPSLVSLTLGADDVDFAGLVGRCYKKYDGGCSHAPSRLDAVLQRQKANLAHTLQEIERRGAADGRKPLVVQTTYYDPFGSDTKCVDNRPEWPLAYLNAADLRFLAGAQVRMNQTIIDVAAEHGALVLDTDPLFADHLWCSPDPWVYGISIKRSDKHTMAPFHPMPAGQQALGEAMATVFASAAPVDAGTDVHVRVAHGALRFSSVSTPGEAAIVPAADLPGSVPPSSGFVVGSAYAVTTSADFSGDVTIALPSARAQQLFQYLDGGWRPVPSAFDGGFVRGTVSSLSPVALGTTSLNPAGRRAR
ncbi:SGNH/GDSL hydrolase family protein [Solirubrobacter phytolaccae]|uniref:SGNH/GDSL hydrolase family protein n=1 Tax=Solirubrobacter phytolaccae TaxID=1404360 RepID=A0A9X3NFH9_9ACTN|nr:SGNH/GDSL hydrolase family protein [Solirubrobacter phytolaccae]MDA0184042.1 SGNH/GDSL hydrolase family protein [Solirubrobacter phytolaccae]